MIDIALADGSVGYYYYNPIIPEILTVLAFFSLSMFWNWAIIKLLNHGKRLEFFDIILHLSLYTFIVFILEIIAFLTTGSPYLASLISAVVIMIAYYNGIQKDWNKAFFMSIFTNPIWLYLLLVKVM